MPSQNIRKSYITDGIYHIYNRGVEKRIIFNENQDYQVFLKYLKEALSPPPDPNKLKITIPLQGETFKGIPRQPRNFHSRIEALTYCLMPNHFHLLVKQKDIRIINRFMQSLCTRYSMYFNKKYKRIGTLFQGPYKAILVLEDPYLLHLSRYIHQNPKESSQDLSLAYSSYADYIGKRKTPWLNTEIILSYFGSALSGLSSIKSYREFVEKLPDDQTLSLNKLTLEDL